MAKFPSTSDNFRTTGGLKAAAGTVYTPGANVFKILVKNTSAAAIDLRAEDDAVYEAVEQILEEINVLAYFTTNDNSGTITVIADKKISAGDLQTRIRRIGKDLGADTTSIGPNDIDVSGTLVTDATAVVAS